MTIKAGYSFPEEGPGRRASTYAMGAPACPSCGSRMPHDHQYDPGQASLFDPLAYEQGGERNNGYTGPPDTHNRDQRHAHWMLTNLPRGG